MRGISWGSFHASGQRRFNARVEGGQQMHKMHLLVARTFLGPSPSSQHSTVIHKDGNLTNNAMSNLQYATEIELRPLALRSLHPTKTEVRCRDVKTDHWTSYSSVTAAAAGLGVARTTVARYCKSGEVYRGEYELHCDRYRDILDLDGEEWRNVVLAL